MRRRLRADASGLLALAREPFVASIVVFASIVVLRFSVHASQRTGILLLLTGPIVLMSLAHRARAGAVMATAGLLVYLLSQHAEDGTIDALAASTRAFAFYAIPFTIGLAYKDAARQSAGERSEPEAPAASPTVERADQLTPREREVLGLVAAGRTNTEIAALLVLSVRTIESHRATLRRKLGRPSHAELVRHAQDRGLVLGGPVAASTDGVPASGTHVPDLVY